MSLGAGISICLVEWPVGNISGGSYRDVYIAEGAEIDSISGGTFTGEGAIYNEGTINTISGGSFLRIWLSVLNYSIGGELAPSAAAVHQQ